MQSKNIEYLPMIDMLRGVAALWIVFYHGYKLFSHFAHYYHEASGPWLTINSTLKILIAQGHTSVTLFMVLSGFIFTWGAFGKSLNYFSFIRNRILRIYPLYLLLLFLGLAAFPTAFSLKGFVCMVLPLSDFYSVQVPGLTTMSWAIAVEFQFYLIFPFLISILTRSEQKTTIILKWIALLIIFRILALVLGGNPEQLTYWHLIGRLDQFLLGMLSAFWLKKNLQSIKHFRTGLIFSLILLVTLLQSYEAFETNPLNPMLKMLMPTIEGGIWSLIVVMLIGIQLKMPPSDNIFKKLLLWLGQRSFSIYLLHFPILLAQRKFYFYLHSLSSSQMLDMLINILFITIPILLFISHLSYESIEKPFLNFRRSYLINN